MVRFRFPLLLGVSLGLLAAPWPFVAPSPAEEDGGFNTSLVLQQAMVSARYYLYEVNEPQKAVATLEQHLAKVNGNAGYLKMLRDAYRAYIKDLSLAGQSAQAQRYLDRLCILDPAAANDPTLRPQQASTKPTLAPPEEPKKTKIFPNFALTNPFAKKKAETPVAAAPVKPTVRGQADDAPTEDPFDLAHRRETAATPPTVAPLTANKAKELLALAEAEFAQKKYPQARMYYEQAYQADKASVADSRERWAYCLLKGVDEVMAQSDLGGRNPAELKQQVQTALSIAPRLADAGGKLLRELEQRGPGGPPTVTASAVSVQHKGRNKEGWAVAETPHFRIFHHRDDAFAEKVAQVVETTRAEMYRKWFGNDGPAWDPKCELILHPSASHYTQMTGVPGTSPGHSRIETDPTGGRVIGRRMDIRLDNPGALEAVLPHETTHVVIAGMYGPYHVPRWVDEGVAVLTEPAEKVNAHRTKLQECQREGSTFNVKELMAMPEYPQPARIPAFYAQSVMLVEFLAAQRGPQVFTQFVRDGLKGGYEAALQRHYGWTFATLEQQWTQHASNGTPAVLSSSARR